MKFFRFTVLGCRGIRITINTALILGATIRRPTGTYSHDAAEAL